MMKQSSTPRAQFDLTGEIHLPSNAPVRGTLAVEFTEMTAAVSQTDQIFSKLDDQFPFLHGRNTH